MGYVAGRVSQQAIATVTAMWSTNVGCVVARAFPQATATVMATSSMSLVSAEVHARQTKTLTAFAMTSMTVWETMTPVVFVTAQVPFMVVAAMMCHRVIVIAMATSWMPMVSVVVIVLPQRIVRTWIKMASLGWVTFSSSSENLVPFVKGQYSDAHCLNTWSITLKRRSMTVVAPHS